MLVGTNWKMNKTRSEAQAFSDVLTAHLDEETLSLVSVFVIPPLTCLPGVESLRSLGVRLGVQNIHWETAGPFTGEISAYQAMDAGASVIEVGHSERRSGFDDSDYRVARKTRAAVEAGATALLCVGEPREIFEMGKAVPYVRGQVSIATSLLDEESVCRLWVAYEPVWAIGEGSDAAQSEHVDAVHRGIRSELETRFATEGKAGSIPILYGGSVNTANAGDFLAVQDVDGLFVGRSALDPEQFVETIRLAARFVKNGSVRTK
jgi:L-erythrulose 1-phosphate isomerase